MDKEEKTKEWMKTRARPGIVTRSKVVHLDAHPQKNAGLPAELDNDHLHCPCSICGHTYQWECDEQSQKEKGGCDCCSSICT